MTSRSAAVLVIFLLALAPGAARAAGEPLGAHTEHQPKSIIIDNERIQPSSLDMTAENALVFENHSTRPITINFIEPAPADEIPGPVPTAVGGISNHS